MRVQSSENIEFYEKNRWVFGKVMNYIVIKVSYIIQATLVLSGFSDMQHAKILKFWEPYFLILKECGSQNVKKIILQSKM